MDDFKYDSINLFQNKTLFDALYEYNIDFPFKKVEFFILIYEELNKLTFKEIHSKSFKLSLTYCLKTNKFNEFKEKLEYQNILFSNNKNLYNEIYDIFIFCIEYCENFHNY